MAQAHSPGGDRLLKKIFCALGVIWSLLNTSADTIVEGTLLSRSSFRDGKTNQSRINFTVDLGECSSRLQAVVAGGEERGIIELGAMGGNSYIRSSVQNPGAGNVANLSLFPGVVPGENGLQLGFLWLAYASGCYLRTNSPGPMEPVVYKLSAPNKSRIRLKTNWRFGQESKRFPAFYQEDISEQLLTESADLKLRTNSLPNGLVLTNCSFRVLTWTNVAGESFPRRFQFTRFTWDENPSSPAMIVWMTGESTNISVGVSSAGLNEPLKVAARTRVVDYRNRASRGSDKIKPLVYLSTNGELKTPLR